MASAQQTILEVAGRQVTITNPDKVFFPRAGHTKLDVVRYYASAPTSTRRESAYARRWWWPVAGAQ